MIESQSAHSEIARQLYSEQIPLINRYVDILASTAVAWGLLGPREADRLWDRHILNSAALGGLIATDNSVVDVGSGAGLPGIPLAILRPDLRMTLIEPLLRRFTFLTQTVEELGITDHVTVVRSRAEDHRQSYDVVVARALAPLDRLVGWCNPLRAPDGVILALKGASANDEIAAANRELAAAQLDAQVLTVRAHPEAEPAMVVRLRPGGANARAAQ
ncbi:MAG TPA: 16S rRNA (guanine(527)-N(7))-methyltransferase RsmG [Propionibacteriaceae bacterium]|nr:16S rRNA (guanine(527)-N(7))-methyltransferase RsmG [Propionibacteriaceae bacterium]